MLVQVKQLTFWDNSLRAPGTTLEIPDDTPLGDVFCALGEQLPPDPNKTEPVVPVALSQVGKAPAPTFVEHMQRNKRR